MESSAKRVPANGPPPHSARARRVPVPGKNPSERAWHARPPRGATAARQLTLVPSSPASCPSCTGRLRCWHADGAPVHMPLSRLPHGRPSGSLLPALHIDRDSWDPCESRPHIPRLPFLAVARRQRSPPEHDARRRSRDQARIASCRRLRLPNGAHGRNNRVPPGFWDRAQRPDRARRPPPPDVPYPTEVSPPISALRDCSAAAEALLAGTSTPPRASLFDTVRFRGRDGRQEAAD